MSLRANLTAIIDICLNIERKCADLDHGFRPDGAAFRFDYGDESFLVPATIKEALRREYRAQTRRSVGLVLLAALAGVSLAIGADLATGRAIPQWLTFAILLGPIAVAGVAFWRNEMRTWNAIIAQMRHHSADTKALAPAPSP